MTSELVGTLVGTDQSGNRYYENKEHFYGKYSVLLI